MLDLVDTLLQLVDTLPRIVRVAVFVRRAKMSPLETVHRPKVALAAVPEPARLQELLRAVPVPDLHALLGQ